MDRNKTVTIATSNLPPNDQFVVRMNTIGTRGINGYKGETFDTGAGGTQELSFAIPSQLKGFTRLQFASRVSADLDTLHTTGSTTRMLIWVKVRQLLLQKRAL